MKYSQCRIMKRALVASTLATCMCLSALAEVHVWETVELTFHAERDYDNPYVDVEFWVQLTGPDFNKKVPGFWDGDNVFRARIMATRPGSWSWGTGANVDDPGLIGKEASFDAIAWTEEELRANPNRHGTVRPTANGHALEYADGTPFVLLADTHWAASTWRYVFKGEDPEPDYRPGPGMGFEELVHHLKRNGFNSIAMITCFPNWDVDDNPRIVNDQAGVQIRQAWYKPGTNEQKAMDMHAEDGSRPFMFPGKSKGAQDVGADYDRINPAYWQQFDRKMAHMSEEGFIPYVETVRRDHFPSWFTYHDFNVSFPRFLNYFRARYGTCNMIYCLAHLDYFPGDWLPEGWLRRVHAGLDRYCEVYGPMPFGQPTTVMARQSSLHFFGHTNRSPWLEMHTSGNNPRHHGIYDDIEMEFRQEPPVPVFNNEPYYVGHNNPATIGGEPAPPPGSERADYYGRAQLYGCVLSGALAGHVFGSLGWAGITTGEPDTENPARAIQFWKIFAFPVYGQAKYMKDFLLSEGDRYQDLEIAYEDVNPGKNPDCHRFGLEGWSFMMRTPDRQLALLYFEVKCNQATLANMTPNATYGARWFNPRTGQWQDAGTGMLTADSAGNVQIPPFPGGEKQATEDWAMKLVRKVR